MNEISYNPACVSVRDDIVRAHRNAWQRLARPGTWWTGNDRVNVAAEVRNAWNCTLCKHRKTALSPNAVTGEHDRLHPLPDAVVETVHRITTDPGRLSREWYQGILASGLEEAPYVEIVGVLATVVSVDTFCRGLGIPYHPLPAPLEGAPSRLRPRSARDEGAWVATIPNGKATGPESDLYREGSTPNIGRALSLVPDELRGLHELGAVHYFPFAQAMDVSQRRSLSRAQMEFMATRVSALNRCFY